jgi:predicted CoA-binding protein
LEVLSDKESQLISLFSQQIYRFSEAFPRARPRFWFSFRSFTASSAGVARQPVPVDFVGVFRRSDHLVRVGRQVMPPDFILVFRSIETANVDLFIVSKFQFM